MIRISLLLCTPPPPRLVDGFVIRDLIRESISRPSFLPDRFLPGNILGALHTLSFLEGGEIVPLSPAEILLHTQVFRGSQNGANGKSSGSVSVALASLDLFPEVTKLTKLCEKPVPIWG